MNIGETLINKIGDIQKNKKCMSELFEYLNSDVRGLVLITAWSEKRGLG